MDADIQFGELEETQPATHLRPDRNKHYAVAAYDDPAEDDLPIFVDLDVMRDMELHASSDTSVELGGVLLGGQFEDEDGNPFVVITDSLRAQHYEATKGSFKFTHDTWEQISRERDEFPEDLQMVGWYHTHPDWGVFLSGMDMFICDNFFNRPLDVALVIDPCRRDRGMFQWTSHGRQRIRQTGGFYIMSSRFRQHELELYIAYLEGKVIMASDPRYGPIAGQIGPSPAPVVNITQPQNQWQPIAVLGILAMQFLFMSLIAWQLFAPAAGDDEAESELAKRVEVIEKQLDDAAEAELRASELRAQRKILDGIVSQLEGGDGVVDKLNELQYERDVLDLAVKGQVALKDKLERENDKLRLKISEIETDLKSKEEQLSKKESLLADQRTKVKEQNDEIAELKKQLTGKDADGWWNWSMYAIAGGIVVVLLVAGVAAAVAMRKESHDDELADVLEDPVDFKEKHKPAPDVTHEQEEHDRGQNDA